MPLVLPVTPISPVVECVANFSEGLDLSVIHRIQQSVTAIDQVTLLHTDIGRAANRTVISFAGTPEALIEAAYQAIKTASLLIDMEQHAGVHPRIGATDVCPLIPIAGISMAEVDQLAHRLAERVGRVLSIPVYCYEESARNPQRKSLVAIRQGEYEALSDKLQDNQWLPDYGSAKMNRRAGATVIGARHPLIAFNVNLDNASKEKARRIAALVRESGFTKDGIRYPGRLSEVRAIAWYIEEYSCFQVSFNVLDYTVTPLHVLYETIREIAAEEHVQVTGSELIGLIPLQALLDAGRFYSKVTPPVSDEQVIECARVNLALGCSKAELFSNRIIDFLLK